MKYLTSDEHMHTYAFECLACHATGELSVEKIAEFVHCPEACGALYVQWLNPLTHQPDLNCVVCPVFEDDEPISGHEFYDFDDDDLEPDFTLDDLEWSERYPDLEDLDDCDWTDED